MQIYLENYIIPLAFVILFVATILKLKKQKSKGLVVAFIGSLCLLLFPISVLLSRFFPGEAISSIGNYFIYEPRIWELPTPYLPSVGIFVFSIGYLIEALKKMNDEKA